MASSLDAASAALGRVLDGTSKTGSVTYVTSDELDLGRDGFGEVEYAVRVKYTIEWALDRIVSTEWYKDQGADELNVRDNNPPMDKIRARVERQISSSKGAEEALQTLADKI